MLCNGLVVGQKTVRSGQNNLAKLTSRQQLVGPSLNVTQRHVETGANDGALVDSAVEVHNNLASALVVDDFELANVAVLHHDLKELHDHLGGGAHKNLALAALLGISNAAKAVVQNRHENHGCET